MRQRRNAQPGNRLHVVHPQPILAIIVSNHQSYDHLTIALSKRQDPSKTRENLQLADYLPLILKLSHSPEGPVP